MFALTSSAVKVPAEEDIAAEVVLRGSFRRVLVGAASKKHLPDLLLDSHLCNHLLEHIGLGLGRLGGIRTCG